MWQASFVERCKEEEIVRKQAAGIVEDKNGGWEGVDSKEVGLGERKGVNPVIMQLSQVNLGSFAPQFCLQP